MSNEELFKITDAIKQISENYSEWENDYVYNRHTNEFRHRDEPEDKTERIIPWFELP
jgi:hypothetical protein